jgi:hypothetical protein
LLLRNCSGGEALKYQAALTAALMLPIVVGAAAGEQASAETAVVGQHVAPDNLKEFTWRSQIGRINSANREVSGYCEKGEFLVSGSCSSDLSSEEFTFTHAEPIPLTVDGRMGWYCRVNGPIKTPEPPEFRKAMVYLLCAK